MRKHIELMLKQGVIEELDVPAVYCSPAMVMFEEKYMASRKAAAMISKFVTDAICFH